MSFQGALYSNKYHYVPVFSRNIPVQQEGQVQAQMREAYYSPVADSLSPDCPLPAEVTVNASQSMAAMEPYAYVSFVPFRKNTLTGQVEKLDSFTLSITVQPLAKSEAASGGAKAKKAASSVLASGDWFKVGVTGTGIYKMDYAFLKNLGLNLGQAANIQVYGKPGGTLPQANSAARDAGLVENAIYVADNNGNGKLDQGEYVLFYAKGPHTWAYDNNKKHFLHKYNIYTDTAYYFVTVGDMPGKRIADQASLSQPADNIVTGYDDYAFHEMDQITDVTRYVKSGREWFGEEFRSLSGNSVLKSFDFNFPQIDQSEPVWLNTLALASAPQTSKFNIYVDGSTVGSVSMSRAPYLDSYLADYGVYGAMALNVNARSPHISVQLEYQKSSGDAVGWLDYLELNVRNRLEYTPGQFGFRDSRTVAAGKVNEYRISNTGNNLKIWDVTDFHNVKAQQASLDGSTLSFRAAADELREYVAFDGNNFPVPAGFGKIANQDLHGLSQADMIIVCHPDFLSAANKLADFHRQHDNFTVHVVTPQQIYNEFSSGGQDVSAIRDFAKMFYDRAKQGQGKAPGYLLLFGDASYDYKNRVPSNTNFVPSYQSFESLASWGSSVADTYFGMLDDNEGWTSDDDGNNMLDISIGRIPVDHPDQADNVVNKIFRYYDKQAYNDWRNELTFIADDPDPSYNIHFEQTERLDGSAAAENPSFNINKIYLDAYKQIGTSNGPRYPDVNKAIDLRMASGTLILNYVGHGSEACWGHERILTIDDINSWSNTDRMPLIITATCEFSRFDDPNATSAGELTLLKPDGGAIALFTTTRVVEITRNGELNRNIVLGNLMRRDNGKGRRLGDIFRQGQNNTGIDNNTRSFTLLGDPAVRLALPENDIVITDINGVPAGTDDSLKALSLVTIKGEVRSAGLLMNNFNGTLSTTVFDKASTRKTLGNEGEFGDIPFTVQDNVIYKGKASVKDGMFSFSFYVPKDIAFNKGFGKLSLYAENGETDASGYYDKIVVGGSADNPVSDNEGPRIRLFMNDTNFVSGGMVDNNPMLIAKISDDMGINTTGNSIGHDLTGTLNNGTPIVMNQYYQADLDNFRAGTVYYPFKDLADGRYTLTMKVWDVSNNSSEASVDFVVANSAKLALDKIMNYPNPFSDQTTFSFEHNRPNENLQVDIAIFNVNGQMVNDVNMTINTGSNRVNSITWDGRDSHGNTIANGMYIYRVTVKTADGQVAQQTERLVVIK